MIDQCKDILIYINRNNQYSTINKKIKFVSEYDNINYEFSFPISEYKNKLLTNILNNFFTLNDIIENKEKIIILYSKKNDYPNNKYINSFISKLKSIECDNIEELLKKDLILIQEMQKNIFHNGTI